MLYYKSSLFNSSALFQIVSEPDQFDSQTNPSDLLCELDSHFFERMLKSYLNSKTDFINESFRLHWKDLTQNNDSVSVIHN